MVNAKHVVLFHDFYNLDMFYDLVMTNYGEEQYVRIITPKKYRSAYAKFRCGVAPIKIETCRYGLNRVPVNERM